MELEKTLYRVHERLLMGRNHLLLRGMLIATASLAAIFIIAFGILNTREGKSYCVGSYSDIANDTLIEWQIYSDDESILTMYQSQTHELITLPINLIKNHTFDVLQKNISVECLRGGFFFNMASRTTSVETLFLNDLISAWADKDVFIRNNGTNETWVWTEKKMEYYYSENLLLTRILNAGMLNLKLMLGLFIQSSIASIYIKMTIICAPIFIILMIECMTLCGNREIQPQVLARAFPWIGAYMNILEKANKTKGSLLLAFGLMLVLFYFIYLSCVFIGSVLLFYKSIPKGLDEDFFGLMAINEFYSMIFLRTRTSMYFYPKMSLVLYLTFLYYVQNACYGFFYTAFYGLAMTTFAVQFMLICFFEVPALTWNPISHYTPSVDRPRCYYLPVFQMGWRDDLPQLWTMFYPLHGRRYFGAQNLALVDRNYPLLNNLLQQDIEMQAQVLIQQYRRLHNNDELEALL